VRIGTDLAAGVLLVQQLLVVVVEQLLLDHLEHLLGGFRV
jgi:hypothetical protein